MSGWVINVFSSGKIQKSDWPKMYQGMMSIKNQNRTKSVRAKKNTNTTREVVGADFNSD